MEEEEVEVIRGGCIIVVLFLLKEGEASFGIIIKVSDQRRCVGEVREGKRVF